MGRIARLQVAICLVVLATVAVHAYTVPEAAAGGSWLDPIADRYEPGETATLVGYTGGGPLGSIDDGPFYGYLFREMEEGGFHPRAIPLPVGELDVTRTGQLGYLAIRVAITFELPTGLDPGIFHLAYCNTGCEKQLGDLLGGRFHVGVDPEWPPNRDWPANEPERVNLAD